MKSDSNQFWKTKSLSELSQDEWESLCDGCAKCCLVQLQDEQTDQLVYTDVACDLLDCSGCRCTDYKNRSKRVPSCMTLNPENVAKAAEFAPDTCAYKLLVEGQDLPDWHHLKSGDPMLIHKQGFSVKDKVRFLSSVDEDSLEDFVVDWPNKQ